MARHSLNNFERQRYYQNKPKVNGRYIINLDEYESIGTHWIALHLNTEIL